MRDYLQKYITLQCCFTHTALLLTVLHYQQVIKTYIKFLEFTAKTFFLIRKEYKTYKFVVIVWSPVFNVTDWIVLWNLSNFSNRFYVRFMLSINLFYWNCRVERGGWKKGFKEDWINEMGNDRKIKENLANCKLFESLFYLIFKATITMGIWKHRQNFLFHMRKWFAKHKY